MTPRASVTNPASGAAKARERPILFSSEMVRAILDGRKTMTRRVIKMVPGILEANYKGDILPLPSLVEAYKKAWLTACPYGQPGDRLWVRETWQHNPFGGIVYRAGSGIVNCDGRGWKPSIFMPRWASRITLEITAVRIERVQDITEEDAKKEGSRGYVGGEGPVPESVLAVEPGYWHTRFFRDGFQFVWDSLNAKRGYGWDLNPFVWVLSFRKLP
jgi:hypothetical protein